MKFLLSFLLLFGLCRDAPALSIDASALFSSNSNQVMLNGSHIRVYPKSSVEVSGKYVRSKGQSAIWDAGMSSEFDLGKGFKSDSDYRVYHSHSTYSGGFGFGSKYLTVTSGARVEYDQDDKRTIFGRLTAIAKMVYRGFGLTGRVEALRTRGNGRLDYHFATKYQIRKFYLALRVEEVRSVKLQGVSLGVTF